MLIVNSIKPRRRVLSFEYYLHKINLAQDSQNQQGCGNILHFIQMDDKMFEKIDQKKNKKILISHTTVTLNEGQTNIKI